MADLKTIHGLKRLFNAHLKRAEKVMLSDEDRADSNTEPAIDRNAKTLASLIQSAERIFKLDQAFKEEAAQHHDQEHTKIQQEQNHLSLIKRLEGLAKRKD